MPNALKQILFSMRNCVQNIAFACFFFRPNPPLSHISSVFGPTSTFKICAQVWPVSLKFCLLFYQQRNSPFTDRNLFIWNTFNQIKWTDPLLVVLTTFCFRIMLFTNRETSQAVCPDPVSRYAKRFSNNNSTQSLHHFKNSTHHQICILRVVFKVYAITHT